ncbi:hypothetical protein Daus18300_010243 [Diaporthe australafricana]|uniref:Uncharacterized protein n=1 Tax=Diaporthe australafricana TaxID=127596 RepID=A0ABR3WB67_9PEZI
MSQIRNPSNKNHVSTLEALKGATKDPVMKANINACLNKARETPDAITRDQVIWAINGKDAFIQGRMEQILKVHKDHKAELHKVFALCLAGCNAMMAGQGDNSSSSNPQQPLKGTALGCIPSKDAKPVPNTTPAPVVAGRAQSTATAGRGQPSATAARATQTKPTFEIPNPTDDEKKAVALYPDRYENHPYGMHTIRMNPRYGLGQKEVNIDINYDTGSTAQGVPPGVLEDMIGKNTSVNWFKDQSVIADGTTRVALTGMFQIKLFVDKQRTKTLQDWFDTYGRVNANFALSGGEMRFKTGLHFASLPGVKSPLIVGKSMPAVIYHMLN